MKSKLSLILPATAFHYFCHREAIEEALHACSVVPDEVIVVVSGISQVQSLRELRPPDQCESITIPVTTKLCTSESRNIGASVATGDVLSFFDFDDNLHPRRFEVIRSIFEDVAIDAAIFGYTSWKGGGGLEHQPLPANLSQLKASHTFAAVRHGYESVLQNLPEDNSSVGWLGSLWCCPFLGVRTVANGWLSVRREVFFRLMYRNGPGCNRKEGLVGGVGEDADLNARISLAGFNFTFFEFSLGFYRIGKRKKGHSPWKDC